MRPMLQIYSSLPAAVWHACRSCAYKSSIIFPNTFAFTPRPAGTETTPDVDPPTAERKPSQLPRIRNMTIFRAILLLSLALVAGACSKPAVNGPPLAFVPADTPFVIASTESMPDATRAIWARQMQSVWPTVIGMYENMVTNLPEDGNSDIAASKRVVQAIIDEVRDRDTPEKWAEVGFSMGARSAFYGVGMVPVVRMELGSSDKFRAMIARIEKNAGASLGTSKVDDQEVRTFKIGSVQGLIAFEGDQLVLSILPADAATALQRQVLGLDPPAQSMEAAGSLAAFNKSEGFLPYGSGWVDFRRIVALIDRDPGYSAWAHMLSEMPPALDEVCRAEIDGIAARAPRLTFGYTRLEGQQMDFRSRLDLDKSLAQSFIKLSSPPAGSAAPFTALYDIAMSLPVLKVKDFLIERSDAVVAAPFKCAELASWNEAARELKQQLTQTVPPPFSDLTSLRLLFERLDIPAQGNPDVSAAVLIGSSDPAALIDMAKAFVPALTGFELNLDGKTANLPAGIIPSGTGFEPAMQIAANDSAIAISIGAGVSPADALTAAVASDGQLMRFAYSGKFYDLLGSLVTRYSAAMPEKQRTEMEKQTALYAIYARLIKSVDMHVNATDKGIEMVQRVELNP
jgi:hypothetical protein